MAHRNKHTYITLTQSNGHVKDNTELKRSKQIGSYGVPGREYEISQDDSGYKLHGAGDGREVQKKIVKPSLMSMWPQKFQQRFMRLFEDEFGEKKDEVVHYKGSIGTANIFNSFIEKVVTPEALPDLLITTDFNSIYGHHFMNRVLNAHNYDSLLAVSKSIYTGTYYNSNKPFNIIASDALVMIVDRRLYANRQQPREWYELLAPWLKSGIIMSGEKDLYSYTFFYHFIKNYGLGVIANLKQNIHKHLSPEAIVDMINGNIKSEANIYVVPYSFASQIDNLFDYSIIWPEDGAIMIPIQMLVRKESIHQHSQFISFLTGKKVRKALEEEGFITPRRKIDLEAQGMRLSWIGWDFITHYDVRLLNQTIRTIYYGIT